MQTLTSIRRRGWSGRIASLPLSYFFLFSFFSVFFAKATGRTVRQIWTNESSKRVVLRKEVPFGGLNAMPLNVGVKIPKKLKLWGVNRTFNLNDKKIKFL